LRAARPPARHCLSCSSSSSPSPTQPGRHLRNLRESQLRHGRVLVSGTWSIVTARVPLIRCLHQSSRHCLVKWFAFRVLAHLDLRNPRIVQGPCDLHDSHAGLLLGLI
jgi:hypothetical protein